MRCRLIALGVAALLLAGCGDDAKHDLVDPGPDYLPLESPDDVVADLVLAWVNGDADGYADLLYDGVAPATDGATYTDFRFVFDRGLDPGLPEFYSYADELECTESLFSGQPGLAGGVPGVKAIGMTLVQLNFWHDVVGGEVDGDPCPDGTVQRAFNTSFLITLKSAIPGSDNITAWYIEDRAQLYCIPVDEGGQTRWRLWKWRDVIDLRTEDASLGQVKALYGP